MANNSNNKDAASTQRRAKEAHVLESFMKVIRRRLENSETIQNLPSMDYNKQSDYKAERNVLMKINRLGLSQGILAGVVTFITLRRAPGLIAKHVMKPKRGGSSYKLDGSNNPFASNATVKAPLIFRAVRFGLDSFVSLLIAASTSLYFTDTKKMMDEIASVPLVEGKSIVADEFCPCIAQEFHKYPKEFWDQTQSYPMRSIKTFVDNCRLRASHQARLRKEQGLSPEDPVMIPPPGVDTTTSLQENDSFDGEFSFASNNENGVGAEEGQLFGDGGEYFGGEEPNGWADSMVTDQEQDKGNGKGRGF